MNMMRNKNRNNNHNHNRNRGGGRRYNNNGGGNRQQNDGQNLARQKHHATQMLGKYSDLMRNAQNNGDRIDVEYYLQHIDHYNRVLADIGAVEAERFAAREAQMSAVQEQPSSGGEGYGEAAGAVTGGEEFSPTNQPRMTRHPRRHYHPPQGEQSSTENPAPAPEQTNNEIPLPGSILPPI